MRRNSRTRRTDGGFTLLETLVALGVTALILAALAGTVGRTARAHGAATNAAARAALARAVLLRVANELEAIDPGQQLVLEANGTLRFGTFARPDGDPLAVAYEVDARAATLTRRQAPARGRIEDQPGVVLLESPAAFHVRALDQEGWHREWKIDTLPRAVEIVLGQDDEELALRIALPVVR